MSGLIKTFVIIGIIIGISTLVSWNVSYIFPEKVNSAREEGTLDGNFAGSKSGMLDGTTAGFQEGSQLSYDDSKIINNSAADFHFSYNPTFDEIDNLLSRVSGYNLADTNNFFEANGIRTAYVQAFIARETEDGANYYFELLGFDTTDKGLIYISPQSNKQIYIDAGRHFYELNNQPAPDYDDTLTLLTIYW